MASVELERNGPRRTLLPIPVVVDACVLLRNVSYTLRKGWNGALLASASGDYTLWSGVVLFTTRDVLDEVEEHLTRIASEIGTTDDAWDLWNDIFLPRLRIVELNAGVVEDPRVDAVRALDPDDAPTAALAVALAPCVLLTDNRKHFEPLGLSDRPVDEIALDIHKVSELMTGANSVVLLTGLTGAGVIEGTRKIVSALGREGSLHVALLLVGAGYLYWRSERGGRFREGVAAFASEVRPALSSAVSEGLALSEEIAALAIESVGGRPSALRFLAQHLATGPTTMSTREIAKHLSASGYRFKTDGDYRTLTRSWLVSSPCFFELHHGHWSLGYHARPRDADV